MPVLIADSLNVLAPRPGTRVLLGYSGGVDSEVLACLLGQYSAAHPEINCTLVHVHHGLSHNAESWVQHCEARAAHYGLEFRLCRVSVDQGPRTSLEAEARKARYQAISQLMKPGDILLTGHHQDDQLETLLLALKRGQGPRGLAAMGKCQPFDNGWQVRPLLDCSRQQIEAFAAANQLTHIQDESNFDTRFDRNFLRQDIIPLLKSRWPQIAHTAARSASLCAEQQLALDEVVSDRLSGMVRGTPWGKTLALDELARQAPHWQKLLLRAFIEQSGLELPSQVQLEQALQQLLEAREDAGVELRFSGAVIRRFAAGIYVTSNQISGTPGQQTLENGVEQVSYGAFLLTLNSASEGPRVRRGKPEEEWRLATMAVSGTTGAMRCHPHFRDKGRELKKCWQEAGVPPWIRRHLPLLFIDGQLAAVPGIWVEKSFLAKAGEAGVSLALSVE